MSKKKNSKWLLIALGIVLFVAIISIMYGEGYLNLGALGVKVRRVAQTTCLAGSEKEDKYCVYTLEPVQYFVMKNGNGYEIYGDNLTKIVKENSLSLAEGRIMSATSYSLMRATPFSSLNVVYKLKDKNGTKIPSLTMDEATAAGVKGARFVEIELPKMIKVRLNSFYLP